MLKSFLLIMTLLIPFTNAKSELRLELTKEQYKKLKPGFISKTKKRFDIYIEAFDGKNFLLEKKGIKFRLKNDHKKTVIQVSKLLSSENLKCDPHTITWKKKNTIRSNNQALSRRLMYQATEIFKYLNSDSEIPKDLIVGFDSQIRKINFKGKDLLFKYLPKNKKVYFLPSHTNKKYRKKIKLLTQKKTFLKLALGKTVEKRKNNKFVTFYELEGDGKSEDIEKDPNLINLFCKKVNALSPSKNSKALKMEKNINLKSYKVRSPFLFKS